MMTTTVIDEAYEFSAPRFYDFIKGETEEQLLKAELWFDSALSYAPSRTYIILTSSIRRRKTQDFLLGFLLFFAMYSLSWFFFRLLEKKILDFVCEWYWIGPNLSVYKCKLSWIFRVSWLWFEDNRNVLSLSLCEFSAVVSVWFGSNLGVSFCRLSKLIFSAFLIGSWILGFVLSFLYANLSCNFRVFVWSTLWKFFRVLDLNVILSNFRAFLEVETHGNGFSLWKLLDFVWQLGKLSKRNENE